VPEVTHPLIRVGSLLPNLRLVDGDDAGTDLRPSSQALLVVFVHPGRCPACASYLGEAEGSLDDLRSWGTALVGVVPAGEPPVEAGFPVLTDEGGESRRRLGIGAGEAAVLLADRWGEVFEVATFGPEHGLPLPRQLVESAKIVDLSCGECNVPDPHWRTSEP